MSQSYRNEIRDDLTDAIQRLKDIVGYHFVWCEAHPPNSTLACTCGMAQMMLNKAKLEAERLEEFSLWQEAFEQ